MENIANIFVKSIFVDNMVFAYFLGMCSFMAVSKNIKTSIEMGIAVIIVLLITMPINYCIEVNFLKEGALSWLNSGLKELDLSYLSFIIFIAVIAAVAQLLEIILDKFSPLLHDTYGSFLPLITVNCAILGGSLFMQQKEFNNVFEVTSYALGSGIGWAIAIIGFAAIREKMEYSNIPPALRGLGINFITVALMALAFMCFSGLKI